MVQKEVVDQFAPPAILYTTDERMNEPWLPARPEPQDFIKPGRFPDKQLYADHFAELTDFDVPYMLKRDDRPENELGCSVRDYDHEYDKWLNKIAHLMTRSLRHFGCIEGRRGCWDKGRGGQAMDAAGWFKSADFQNWTWYVHGDTVRDVDVVRIFHRDSKGRFEVCAYFRS